MIIVPIPSLPYLYIPLYKVRRMYFLILGVTGLKQSDRRVTGSLSLHSTPGSGVGGSVEYGVGYF